MRKSILLFFIICAACNKEATTDDTPIDVNGQILFLSQRIPDSPDWQMFLMNADGTNQRLVTTHRVVGGLKPIISYSRTKVAFTTYENEYYRLYVIDTNGQNLTFLSQGKQFCGNPSWAPDDSRLLFMKSDDLHGSAYDIYTISPTGTNMQKLTEGGISEKPNWARDGKSIFYTAADGDIYPVYKMNRDGSNKQRLTPQRLSFYDPRPSPDGTRLAVISSNESGPQIFLINTDGSGLKQLTFTHPSQYVNTGFPREGNRDPVWSPNSTEIAYVSWENGSPDIFVMRADGTKNKRLTDTPMRDEHPSWTRDGRYILFTSNRQPSRATQIFIMHKDGRQQHAVASANTVDTYPELLDE